MGSTEVKDIILNEIRKSYEVELDLKRVSNIKSWNSINWKYGNGLCCWFHERVG